VGCLENVVEAVAGKAVEGVVVEPDASDELVLRSG
jgi:hypothetical protein